MEIRWKVIQFEIGEKIALSLLYLVEHLCQDQLMEQLFTIVNFGFMPVMMEMQD